MKMHAHINLLESKSPCNSEIMIILPTLLILHESSIIMIMQSCPCTSPGRCYKFQWCMILATGSLATEHPHPNSPSTGGAARATLAKNKPITLFITSTAR